MEDSFFDMPAGYRDADLEMAELGERGNWWARLVRYYGEDGATKLRDGETIEAHCRRKDTGENYTVRVRLDLDARIYSMDGEHWFDSAREAHNDTSGPGKGE